MTSIGEELTNVPIEEMIGSMGRGIAQAQYDLDMTGIRIAQFMSGFNEDGEVDNANRVTFGQKDGELNLIRYSLLELGFTPTFYQFTETTMEVKVSITIGKSSASSGSTSRSSSSASGKFSLWSGSANATAVASSVNASYSNKYQYSAEGSSMMRTKLTPVPAPALLNERIRDMLEDHQEDNS
jgi:hypothetical protein